MQSSHTAAGDSRPTNERTSSNTVVIEFLSSLCLGAAGRRNCASSENAGHARHFPPQAPFRGMDPRAPQGLDRLYVARRRAANAEQEEGAPDRGLVEAQ